MSDGAGFNDDLQFQDFSHSGAQGQASLGSLSQPIGDSNADNVAFLSHDPVLDDLSGQGKMGESFSFWQFKYYAKWFNIDTKDVFSRIAFATLPFSSRFFEKLNGNPDLYGPFWIASTVVFMLAATANFAIFLEAAALHGMDKAPLEWEIDFTLLSFGSTLIYGYTFAVPLLVYVALAYAATRVSVMEVICLYGYSLFIYIPVSIVCVFPSTTVQWLAVAIGALASTTFVVRSMRFVLQRDRVDAKLGSSIVLACGVGSLLLAFILKLYLFQGAAELASTSSTKQARATQTQTPTNAQLATVGAAAAAPQPTDSMMSSATDIIAQTEEIVMSLSATPSATKKSKKKKKDKKSKKE